MVSCASSDSFVGSTPRSEVRRSSIRVIGAGQRAVEPLRKVLAVGRRRGCAPSSEQRDDLVGDLGKTVDRGWTTESSRFFIVDCAEGM